MCRTMFKNHIDTSPNKNPRIEALKHAEVRLQPADGDQTRHGAFVGDDHSFPIATDERLVRWFRRAAMVLAISAAAMGGWYLAAWFSGSMAFRGFDVITMKTNTALSILLLGMGLLLLIYQGTARPVRIFAWLFAGIAVVIGMLTLSEHLFGWNLGIDQLLAQEPPGALGVTQPNRMGPPAALSFSLAGIALFLLFRRPRGTLTAQFLGLVVFLMGLLGFVGFLYEVRVFYAITRWTTIAWPTSLSLMFLGLGISLSRPDEGIMKILAADDPGGSVARRLLPLSVLLPLILGYFRLAGERMDYYDPAMGTGLIILIFMIVFSSLIFVISHGLSRSHVVQYRAQQALHESEQRLRNILNNMVAMIGLTTPDGTLIEANRNALEIANLQPEDVLGKPFEDCYWWAWSPGVQKRLRNAIDRAAAGRGSRYDEVIRVGEGRFRTIDFMISPIFNSDRRISYLIPSAIDITERRQAEEQVESLARFPEENPNPVMRTDSEGRLLYGNTASRPLLDCWETGIGKHLPAEWADTAREALSDGSSKTVHVKSGNNIYLFDFSPMAKGPYINLYGRNITAQKAAEELLRQSESFHRQTLESIPGMVFTTRPNGYCDYQSQQWIEFTGVPMSEHLGDGWNRLLHPDDRPRAFAAWQDAVKGKAPYDLEYRVRRSDGEYEWFKVIGRPIRDEAGRIVRWFGTALNIETLKRVEASLQNALAETDLLLAQIGVERQRLKTILHQLPSGVLIAEAPSGRVTYANKYALEIYGPDYPRGGAETYLEKWQPYYPNGQPFDFDRLPMVRALRGQTTTGEEIRFRKHGEGEWVDLEANGAPILDRKGRVVEGMVTLIDITDRKKREVELRDSAARIQASLKEKEILLKEIHHRVKNNMQVISSLISLQADELRSTSMENTFKELSHRVQSMAMVHEKLYQSGDLARVDFADYVRSLLDYLWRAYGTASSGIRLVMDLEPVFLSIISAVPCGLILNELVTNAIKHAFSGRAEGEITVSLRGDANSRICLRVSDNGIGLPEGFDWKQSPSLGLRLVRMLSGQLRAEAEASRGEGTEFAITFKEKQS